MSAIEIIKNQLSKLSTFIYLLILLFGVNLIFNLNYQWSGISLIVKVYLFLYSFLIMYNFSNLDIVGMKREYSGLYGKKGIYILFFVTRVFPVVLIYLSVIFYTLIEDIKLPYWPVTSLMEIITGRNSNIVFLAIILLVILKWKKKPGITIPVFLGFAILHFILYKSIYRYLPLGIPVTVIKLVEFFAFLLFLIYEFNSEKRKILKSLMISFVVGFMMYFSFIGVYSLIYICSDYSSHPRIVAARILLKMGYSFPLNGLEQIITKTGKWDLVDELIFYSRKYDEEINFSQQTWKNIFVSSSMNTGENIVRYIMKHDIDLTYQRIISYAEIKSLDDGMSLIRAKNLISYTRRYSNYYNDLLGRYRQGNDFFKIWIMKVITLPGNVEMVPFLAGELMGTNDIVTHEAYLSLKKITGLDPVGTTELNENDSDVIVTFMKFYRQRSIHP